MKRVFMALALISAVAPAIAAPTPSAEEQSAWIAVSRSDDKDSYDEFVRKFPDGTFAALARIRLDEISGSVPGVSSAGSIPDLAPLEGRYAQKRKIEPRARNGCLDSPDPACLLAEITGLIDKQTDATQRLTALSTLAQELAQAGDVASATKYLQQAASIARQLASPSDQASYLATLGNSAAAIGDMQLAGDLLNEGLAAARSVNTGKTDDQSIEDRGRALIDVASHFALIGKINSARPVFAEASGLLVQLRPVYKASLMKEIAQKQSEGGLLQDAILTISDYLNLTNDMPQYSPLGVVELLGRYSNMGDAAEFIASIGRNDAAITLARSVGPLPLRVEKLLRVRDKLSDTGVRDLSALDGEIRDVARDAAKENGAWIHSGTIGCALARFASPSEGTSVARNLFAQAIGNPPYYAQAMLVECLARYVGAENAGNFLMSTRLPSDPKAAGDFKRSVVEIVEAYARQGDRSSMDEWVAKLPVTDRSSTSDTALYYFEEGARNRIKALGLGGQFKEAIAEAVKLENSRDSELIAIVSWAVNGKDLNSALAAARLIKDESSKLGAYTDIIEIM